MVRVLAYAALALTALTISACAQGGFADAGQGGNDSGGNFDAGRDAGFDAGRIHLPDAGRDGMVVMIDAGGEVDAGFDAGMGGACAPAATNLAIVEVMVRSRTGGDDRGEWFEVRNFGGCTINLMGMVIDGAHTVVSGFLAPGESRVFARSGDVTENHGLPHDYVYGLGVEFANESDTLLLTHPSSGEVDRVSWGSTDHMTGRSRQYSSSAAPASNGNLNGVSWCNSSAVYSSATGGPYLGTPQATNAACP